MLYCGKVRICGTIYGQSIGEMWLKRGSSSSCCKPSLFNDLKLKRHLFALISLERTCTLYLQLHCY